MLEFEYKCPVCRAKNILTKENSFCRRCLSDFEIVYKIKKEKFYLSLKNLMNYKSI